MTSQHSAVHGCWTFDSALDDTHLTLAEILRTAGFSSHGVGSHVFLAAKYGLQQGFDSYDDALVLERFGESHRAITSEQVSQRAITWLRGQAENDGRFFLWVHYFDPHAIYQEHPGISERFGTDQESHLYDGEIAFTDAAIGNLLEAVDDLGLAEDTLVVLTADHGESFGERGAGRHGQNLFGELLNVPLLFRIPNEPHRVVEGSVSLLDVAPTALDLLAIPTPPDLAGRSLAPVIAGETLEPLPVIAEIGLNFRVESMELDAWKLIRPLRGGRVKLYDLLEDPRELRNVAEAHPERVAEMGARLDAELAGARGEGEIGPPGTKVRLTREELEALRNLGYLE
jgi:arylsulfatase A-like enzyme